MDDPGIRKILPDLARNFLPQSHHKSRQEFGSISSNDAMIHGGNRSASLLNPHLESECLSLTYYGDG